MGQPTYTTYVVGFLFNTDRSMVVLSQKNRPDWQRGKLNGPGGKVENDERPQDAMAREFEEETGVRTTPHIWTLAARVVGPAWRVDFFYAIHQGCFDRVRTVTDELIGRYHTSALHGLPLIANLHYLIPFCLFHGSRASGTSVLLPLHIYET